MREISNAPKKEKGKKEILLGCGMRRLSNNTRARLEPGEKEPFVHQRSVALLFFFYLIFFL